MKPSRFIKPVLFSYKIKIQVLTQISLIVFMALLVGCHKNPNADYLPAEKGKDTVNYGIKKLENPFSVENMIKAYAAIKKEEVATARSTSGITATHYYIKFMPKDSVENEALLSDTTLNLFPYPLDVQFPEGFDLTQYRDEGKGADDYPNYYAAIPVDKKIPAIGHQILEKLFIPDEGEDDEGLANRSNTNKSINGISAEELEEKSLELTGNADEEKTTESDGIELRSRGSWRPAGRIRVWDTRLNQYIGLEGIRIQARRWFTIHTGYTNREGNFSVNGTFRRPANYSMWYATNEFSVRRQLVSTTANFNGPKRKGSWNLDLRGGFYDFAAHIFRGAYRYHFKDIGGLRRPSIPGPNRQIYIAKEARRSWQGINWIVFPAIQIARYSKSGTEYGSDEIFSTTCHETAHTAHVLTMNAGPVQYSQVDRMIQESWCVAVEWLLTGMEYRERGISNYGQPDYNPDNPPGYPNRYAYQYWNRNDFNRTYTSLFVDIIDNYNQLGQILFVGQGGTGIVDDQVSGYTLANIQQNFLKHVYGRASLAQKLKKYKPVGSTVTDEQIDRLISFF